MHIVYAMQEYPLNNAGCAGSGNYVRNIAKIMADRGHEVEVVTEGTDEKVIDSEGICVHILNIEKYFHDSGKKMTLIKKVIKNIFRSYRYNTEIKAIHNSNPVDIIQYGAMYNLAFFRIKQIPALIRLSEYPVLWRKAANEKNFCIEEALTEKRLDEELQIYTYKKVDQLIAPSFLLKRIVEERTGKEVNVVESPLCMDKSKEYYEQQHIDERIEGKKFFFYYGGISARKEAHIMGEIIPQLLTIYSDYFFVIAGKCIPIPFDEKKRSILEIIDEYQEDIKERCIYLGNISNRDSLFSVIAKSDLCVLPTRIDNLPNTVIECMGLGKIVVSTDNSSVEQLIIDGENGFLCKRDSAQSLLQNIQEAMNLTNEERDRISKKAKERVLTMKPDVVYENMLQIYQTVIKKHKSFDRENG